MLQVEFCMSASHDSSINTHSPTSVTIPPIVSEDSRSYENQMEAEETNNVPSHKTFAFVSKKKKPCALFVEASPSRLVKDNSTWYSHRLRQLLVPYSKRLKHLIFAYCQNSITRTQYLVIQHDFLLTQFDSSASLRIVLMIVTDIATKIFIKKHLMQSGTLSRKIKKKKIFYLTQLLLRYKALLLEFGESKVCLVDFESYRDEHLEKKILIVFGDRLNIQAFTGP